ncbi:MAG: hypothetical protein KatS3mg068_0657 [Candidatus Sericytochromatia bacterium]|nr:MAG: hypothetical protein KatS3mg068_0657 [Candidatus Sericytochromatia bacterium]
MSKKVLIYEPFVLFYFHFLTSLEIAFKNINEGNIVNYLVCKSNLLTCYSNPSHNLNVCISCNALLENAFKRINLPKENIIIFDIEKYRKNIKIPNFKDLEDLKNFEIDGIDFGQAAYSSLVNIKREPFPDIHQYMDLINKMLIDEIAIYRYATELLKNNKYDIVYLFNGRHSTQRPFLRALQKLKIKTFVYEVGSNSKTYSLTEDTYPHDYNYITKQISIFWEKEKDYNKKYQVAETFYLKRLNGYNCPPFHSFTDKQKLGKLPENFDKNKINIVIFNSSENEYVGFKEYQNNLYKKEVEIFEKIFKFTKDKNIHYYLRVHPNLKDLNNSQTKSINELKYDNLTVIPPESDISTYDLMKVCDKVIVTISTTGIEANFFGKVVISLGKSFYDKLNVAYKPKTFKELMKLIEDENLKPLSNEGAIKYAWWFENYGIEFKYYEPEKSGGKFLGEKIEYKINIYTLNNIFQDIYKYNFKPIENQEDLVSVIIVINNKDEKTYDSISSVLNQSYKNIELIIMDINNINIENNLPNDGRIKYFKYKDIIIPKARNKSIKLSKGKYLIFLESGNILLKNSIELMISKINEKKDLEAVIFGYFKNDNNNVNTIELSPFISDDKNKQLKNWFFYKSIKLNSLFLNKSIFNNNYFDESLYYESDYDFCNKILINSSYSYINIPLYILHPDKENFETIYYEDIAKYRILNNISIEKLFKLEEDKNIIEYLDNSLNSFESSQENMIYYETTLKLIELAQKIEYSKNRENKKLFLINNNNTKLLNMIMFVYKDIDTIEEEITKDFIITRNKKIFIKKYLTKNDNFLREYYEHNYLHFVLKTTHKIISCNWYLRTIPDDIINYVNLNIDLVLVYNEYIYKNLSNLGFDKYKIKILREFINYEIFKPINTYKNDFTFIYTGKITFLTGIDLLIDAFKEEFKVDNVKLIIHSDGIYDIEYFEKLKEKLNDKIKIITDNFSEEELNEFINKSSCFVYPYRLEGSLVNILKAIACNIPVILTDKGISEELPDELFTKVCSEEIEDEEIILSGLSCTGTFTYYEVNKENLKLAMREVYSNYELYKEKAFKLREYVIENYNVDLSLSNLNEFLEELKSNIPISNDLNNFKNLLLQNAMSSFQERNYKESENYFSRLICYDKDLNYYYYLGLSLYYQEKYEEAIDYLSEALSLGLYNYDIISYICNALYQTGDIENYNYYKEKLLQFK